MKVCYVNAYYDADIVSGDQLVDRIYTVRELAREQAKLGAEVYVLQLFHRDEAFVRDRVSYRFVRPANIPRIAGSIVSYLRPSTPPAHYQLCTRMIEQIQHAQPDVIHFFGLTLDVNLKVISHAMKKLGIPLVVQYNGGYPPGRRLRRAIQRGNLRRIDRLLFTTREHARPWIDNGMLRDRSKVVPIMETSSVFRWQPRQVARERTGMAGDPVFLWTGRLHPEKDPFTALRGFELIASQWPGARLYLHYLTAELLSDLQQFARARPHLVGKVHFQGKATYEEMALIYNSADFFLQASSREVAGCAMLEAMSCGVIPAVTDIPSFRAMTDGGRFGILFPRGDDNTLARKVLALGHEAIPQRSNCVREYFEENLSFPALARTLNAVYRDLVDIPGDRPSRCTLP